MRHLHHTHPPAEFDAPAWDLERLRTHMTDMHGFTPATPDLLALSAIHAAEHPVTAGIDTANESHITRISNITS